MQKKVDEQRLLELQYRKLVLVKEFENAGVAALLWTEVFTDEKEGCRVGQSLIADPDDDGLEHLAKHQIQEMPKELRRGYIEALIQEEAPDVMRQAREMVDLSRKNGGIHNALVELLKGRGFNVAVNDGKAIVTGDATAEQRSEIMEELKKMFPGAKITEFPFG